LFNNEIPKLDSGVDNLERVHLGCGVDVLSLKIHFIGSAKFIEVFVN